MPACPRCWRYGLRTRHNTLGHGLRHKFWWYDLFQLGGCYRLGLWLSGRGRHRLCLLHRVCSLGFRLREKVRFWHDWWRWLYEHFRRNQVGCWRHWPERATDHGERCKPQQVQDNRSKQGGGQASIHGVPLRSGLTAIARRETPASRTLSMISTTVPWIA